MRAPLLFLLVVFALVVVCSAPARAEAQAPRRPTVGEYVYREADAGQLAAVYPRMGRADAPCSPECVCGCNEGYPCTCPIIRRLLDGPEPRAPRVVYYDQRPTYYALPQQTYAPQIAAAPQVYYEPYRAAPRQYAPPFDPYSLPLEYPRYVAPQYEYERQRYQFAPQAFYGAPQPLYAPRQQFVQPYPYGAAPSVCGPYGCR